MLSDITRDQAAEEALGVLLLGCLCCTHTQHSQEMKHALVFLIVLHSRRHKADRGSRKANQMYISFRGDITIKLKYDDYKIIQR